YSGTVDVFKDIASNCHISVIFDPIGMKADVSIASPESFCAYWSINSNPHEYSVSGTTITIQDVNMDPNRCFDDLIATYDSVNDTVSVDDELTDRDGGRNCFITSNGPLMH
ncbi:MAG: hypothetical protein ACREB0_04790, partial [Sphingopyxis sp.]